MFTSCARVLHVDTSAWPAVPLFQLPPPPPPIEPAEGTKAKHNEKVALGAEDIRADL